MLTVEEARGAVLARVGPLPPRACPLDEALGCTLAEDIRADRDLPPFDKALVDGYAVRSADLTQGRLRLRVIEEITAGRVPSRPLAPGEAAAIMTGAPLPEGADVVVMVERTQRVGDVVIVDGEARVGPGTNRLARGREMRAGEIILRSGTSLNPPRLGLLASVGRMSIAVIPRPFVAILPTGDEVVEPDHTPGPGQIRNSNGPMLQALVQSQDASAAVLPIAPDEPEPLRDLLRRGLEADLLLVTGGVSAGRKDLVPGALADLGVEQVFHQVRVKPGKPLWFGLGPRRGDGRPGALVFGLPGNPVSGLVSFLLFVAPALRALAQRSDAGGEPRALYPLAVAFAHRGDRPTYHPSRLVPGREGPTILPLDWAGSADLRAVAEADGFAAFPAGDRDYQAGAVVEFLAFPR
ncbi:MAG: molybdopterin molybdotransferase MoeA [Isosphaeraceae bacterium]|nr:molybdopterin molybdotransferase MoeA [Isosphaeraceae bacterium]